MFVKIYSLVVLVAAVSPVLTAPGDTVTAQTTNGQVLGLESSTLVEEKTFYVFRGIPYATPPIGDLRFRAPLPASNWTGTYNATYPRSICTQIIDVTNSTTVGSEDCLFINVYTTETPGADSKLPTIVWIHGGGFIAGSGDLNLHGADRFLNNGTIIVSLNYRLGAFGFLSTEDSVCPGNFGLKDVLLALQWVQNNIQYFGGDPSNVTIMGESAGAALVHHLVISSKASGTPTYLYSRGLFQKAISESGDALNPWAIAYNPVAVAYLLGAKNFVFALNSQTLIDGLRKVNASQLEVTSMLLLKLKIYEIFNGLPYAPVIEPNSAEAVLTNYSYVQLDRGDYNRVPFLHGFNSLETREIKKLPWYAFALLLPENIDPSNLTPDDMHANLIGKRLAGDKIKNFYFHGGAVSINTELIYYANDNEFIRGIVKSSELQAKYTPVYLYRFAFTGSKYHNSFNPEGASHGEELPFLWIYNETDVEGNGTTSQYESITAIRMVELWTNFAKTGNPTPYLDEYVNVTWPEVNYKHNNDLYYYNIDVDLEVRRNPEYTQMQFWDGLYDAYGHPPYNTY